MDKNALLSEIAEKHYKLGRVAPVELSPADTAIREEEGIKWYLAGVYEKSDDRLIRKNISFYVEKEGEAEELSCYAEKIPADTPSKTQITTFKDLVNTEIAKKITGGTILKGVIDTVDETNEFALITAYQIVSTEVVVKKYFAYNNLANALKFELMKDV